MTENARIHAAIGNLIAEQLRAGVAPLELCAVLQVHAAMLFVVAARHGAAAPRYETLARAAMDVVMAACWAEDGSADGGMVH